MTPEQLPLRDIHLPDPVSFWPLAPGWWLVMLAFALVLFAAALGLRKRRKRQLYREAIRELELIYHEAWVNSKDQKTLVREFSVLLRRVAVSLYPRGQVAGLVGENWLEFLDRALCDTGSAKAFTTGAGRIFVTAPYCRQVETDPGKLLRLCRTWIKAASDSAQGARR